MQIFFRINDKIQRLQPSVSRRIHEIYHPYLIVPDECHDVLKREVPVLSPYELCKSMVSYVHKNYFLVFLQ